MITRLKSYVRGTWIEGKSDGVTLVDPTTEEPLAQASTEGVDMRGALDYARARGGPALRELSFAQRGELLGAMSKAIHEKREELIELAIANGGNTRGDAKFDLDGATGTLAFYAKLGQSLGGGKLLHDGDFVQLTRNPRYVGRHVFVPLQGAAIHINAFNFPAWGFAEKAAQALLAGMPIVTKPATSTALVAFRIAELLAAAKILPDGAFSFIAGSVGNLLDHVGWQDVIAFTGSSDTGRSIRTRPNLLAPGVRVNVEADSLNAAVLGSDAQRGSPTWELFLREVLQDMTQKAGQKCTAIRRVFVPKERLAEVREDLRERLAETKVGDPSLREVSVGPVATAQQLRDVRAGIEKLAAAGGFVFGDGGRGQLVGVTGERGYFVGPTLLEVADARAAMPIHEHEVFGPTATLLPYDGAPSELAQLVQLGGGSLVSSIYTDDTELAHAMVLGIAPFNGRLTVGSAKVAEHSMGPGTALPTMVHGGPGRAGGGEELGGTRGLALYMQRTAVQGYGPLLEKIL